MIIGLFLIAQKIESANESELIKVSSRSTQIGISFSDFLSVNILL